jgi:hypothetical protein
MPDGSIYRELSKKVGAGDSEIVPLIWKAVCSEDEARLIIALPASAEELAERFEKTCPEMDIILQSLFRKGLVFEAFKDGRPIYRMPRHIIQFHDASSLWPEAPGELFDLWRRYLTEVEYPQVPPCEAIQPPRSSGNSHPGEDRARKPCPGLRGSSGSSKARHARRDEMPVPMIMRSVTNRWRYVSR